MKTPPNALEIILHGLSSESCINASKNNRVGLCWTQARKAAAGAMAAGASFKDASVDGDIVFACAKSVKLYI
jgi:hypothetical protein